MKKITELTKEQKNQMKSWAEKWIKIGLSTERLDLPLFTKAIHIYYQKAGLNFDIPIIPVSSPYVGSLAAPIAAVLIEKKRANKKIEFKKEELFWHYWLGGSLWCWWNSFTTFFTEVCNWKPNKDIMERLNAYADLSKSACYVWPNKDFIMVCDRPIRIERNVKGQLHSTKAKAIEWPDGWGLWMLNGVTVTEKIVLHPETLTKEEILGEKNVDIRREMIRQIGMDRFIALTQPKILDKQGDYELLSLNLSDTLKDCRYLKMKNPSIGVYHIEGVEKECDTVQQAINWRSGDINKFWAPEKLS